MWKNLCVLCASLDTMSKAFFRSHLLFLSELLLELSNYKYCIGCVPVWGQNQTSWHLYSLGQTLSDTFMLLYNIFWPLWLPYSKASLVDIHNHTFQPLVRNCEPFMIVLVKSVTILTPISPEAFISAVMHYHSSIRYYFLHFAALYQRRKVMD